MEVIVTTPEEAVIAESSGASRLELVAERERGGLTPSLDVVRGVVGRVKIAVHAMLRPHDDDFTYGVGERRLMRRTAAQFADAGVQGIVFGALDAGGALDLRSLADICAAAPGVQFTFHRAFDHCADPRGAFQQLAGVPAVTRLLTAGAAPDAWSGRSMLRELVAMRKPAIVAAGGIDAENAAALATFTGAREFHVGSGARTNGKLDPRKIRRLASTLDSAPLEP